MVKLTRLRWVTWVALGVLAGLGVGAGCAGAEGLFGSASPANHPGRALTAAVSGSPAPGTSPATTTTVPHPRGGAAATTASHYEALGARVTPTVLGLSIARAQQVMRAAGISAVPLSIGNEEVSSAVAPETVLSQTPPPGTLTFTSPPNVKVGEYRPSGTKVTIAVPSTTDCTAEQLSLSFMGVYDGASQHLFAGLEVRNVSSQWCSFLGPIQVVGLNAAGDPVTTAATEAISNSTVDVLSPNTPPVPTTPTSQFRSGQFYPVGVFWGWIGIDGPDCAGRPGTLVTPATWRVTLPGAQVLTVPNGTGSPASSTAPPPRPLESCQGAIGGTGATVRDGEGPRLLG